MSFDRHLAVQLDRLGRDHRDIDDDAFDDHDYDRHADGEYAL